jgi:hypothetical protein
VYDIDRSGMKLVLVEATGIPPVDSLISPIDSLIISSKRINAMRYWTDIVIDDAKLNSVVHSLSDCKLRLTICLATILYAAYMQVRIFGEEKRTTSPDVSQRRSVKTLLKVLDLCVMVSASQRAGGCNS